MNYRNIPRSILLRIGLISGLTLTLPALLSAQTEGGEASEEIITLTPYEVKSDTDRGYASTYSMGGSRINTELSKLPLSVIPVNEHLISDLLPVDLIEALQYVSGIAMTSTPRANQLIIRGLPSTTLTHRDGIQESAAHEDPIVIQRLEIVKGPAGVLFGSHKLGGIVNRVTKVPFKGDRTSIGIDVRSYDTYGVRFDINRAFGKNDQWWGRILYHYQDGHMRANGIDDERTLVSMLTFEMNEKTNTRLAFRYHFNRYHYMEPRGVWFADPDGVLPFGIIPVDARSGNVGDPDVGNQAESHNFELGFTHSFDMLGTNWFMRANVRHRDQKFLFRIYLPRDHGLLGPDGELLTLEDGTTRNLRTNTTFADWKRFKASGEAVDIVVLPFIARHRPSNLDETVFSFDLTSEFDTGGLRHNLMTYTQFSNNDGWFFNSRYDWDTELQSVFNVQPRDPAQVLSNWRPDNPREPGRTETEGFNWAIQDSVSVFEERLVFSAGIRYDWGRGATFRADGSFLAPETNTDWTKKFGAIFEIVDGVNLFYSNSETFIPASGENVLGEKFDNQEGLTDEFGAKLNLWEDRVVVTTSYFKIDFTNQRVSEQDVESGSNVVRQIGTAKTKGWEADMFFQPIDAISLMIGLQDVNTENIQRSGASVRPRGVPIGFNYSFLGKYTFQKGPLEGFSVGLTYKSIQERAGDSADRFTAPGYEVMNLFLSYKKGKWLFRGFIDNLTNEEYLITPVASFLMTPGDKTTYRFAMDYTF